MCTLVQLLELSLVSLSLPSSLTQRSVCVWVCVYRYRYPVLVNISISNQPTTQLQVKWTVRRGRCVYVRVCVHTPYTLTFKTTNVFQLLLPSGGRPKDKGPFHNGVHRFSCSGSNKANKWAEKGLRGGSLRTHSPWAESSTAWPDIYLQGPWSTPCSHLLISKMQTVTATLPTSKFLLASDKWCMGVLFKFSKLGSAFVN